MAARAWRHGPSYGCLGARRWQQSASGAAALASRLRHSRGVRAPRRAEPVRWEAASANRSGLGSGRGGAGEPSHHKRAGLARGERGAGPARPPGRAEAARTCWTVGVGGAARRGKGEGSANPASHAVEFGLDVREGRGLRAMAMRVDPPVHGRRAGPGSADVTHWCVRGEK